MLGGRGGARAVLRRALLSRDDARRAHRRRSEHRLFAHLAKLDAAFYDTAKTGELVSRLTADTTQMKSAFGSSASVVLRNLFLFLGADRADGDQQPETLGLCADRHSGHRAAAVRLRPLGPRPLAQRAGYAGRGDRLCRRKSRRHPHHAGFRRRDARRSRAFAAAVERAYAAALHGDLCPRHPHDRGHFPRLCQRRRRPVARRAGCPRRPHDRRRLLTKFLLYAVLGASSLGQLSEVWSEISAAAGAAGRIAEILAIEPRIVAPAHPAALAGAGPRRDHFRGCRIRLSERGRTCAALHGLSFKVRPRRDGGDRRAVGRRQIDGVPASDALLRSDRGPHPARRHRHRERRSARSCARKIALVQQDPTIFGAQRRRQHRAMGAPMPRDAEIIARRRARRGGRIHHGDAGGLRHAHRRARRDACRAANASASPLPAPS